MNLDDRSLYQQLDSLNMIEHINNLPDQLAKAWTFGQKFPVPSWTGIERLLVAGMGGSAIGADMVAAYLHKRCALPIIVHRNYGLPAWAQGQQTLVIASSHSGNTEETLSSYQEALQRGCRCLALTTGGKLAELADKDGVLTWKFGHMGQPRAAVGFSFGLLLALFTRLGLIADPSKDIEQAVAAMKMQQTNLGVEVPVVHNPGKRMAGQLVGRWVAVIAADILAPVARRWKTQINELAKVWAEFDLLPEADHNTLAGTLNPAEVLTKVMVLFLRAPSYHSRNWQRLELTRQAFMLEGLNTDFIDAQGETEIAQQWTILHLGDYIAYYLAMAYGMDPTRVTALNEMKQELSGL